MSLNGIFTMICAIALLVVAAIFGLMALSEFADYANAVSSGNPFAGIKGNSGMYLLGTAAVGGLSGVGLLLVSLGMKKP